MQRGHAFLLALLAVVSLLVFVVVSPFLEYILLALILAYVLAPLHDRLVGVLERRTPIGRFAEPVSAVALLVGSFVALVLPLAYLSAAFLEDLRQISRGETDLETDLIEDRLAEFAGVEIDVQESAGFATEWVFDVFFGDVSALVEVALHASLGVALVLFLVFYLLLDGRSLVAWLTEASPLSPEVSATLIDQIDRTTWGAVIGHAFAAVVQALVAGLGFYLAGISNVVFWTIVMVILAFLPLIGVFLVWAPAAGYLYLVGEPSSAAFLALYGLTVVSFIDYFVRPIVIDKRARLNPAVILVGVFGGVYTLGFVGLFVGPILIGVLVAIVETFRTEYQSTERPAAAETDDPEPAGSEPVADALEGRSDEGSPTAR